MTKGFLHRLAGSVAGLCLLGGTAALAADYPPIAPPPPPVFTWTGPYVGLHIGGAFAGNISINGSPIVSSTFGRDGVFGGAHLGYNYQMNSVVIGLQAEYNFAGITGSATAGPFAFHSAVRQFGSIDGRLGLAFNRWLIYAIGGFAYSDPRHSIVNDGIPLTRDYAANEYGWDVGGGVEYAFMGNWTGRIEYRYYNWGNKGYADTLGYGLAAGATGVIPSHTTTEQLHTVRAGLTYKFNWPQAPVVASY